MRFISAFLDMTKVVNFWLKKTELIRTQNILAPNL